MLSLSRSPSFTSTLTRITATRDSHLTLFTGPARTDDTGVRAFVARLRRRNYRGAVILEQWPHPPELLVEAATRLRALLGQAHPTVSEGRWLPSRRAAGRGV
jgi:hypothetical protein